MKSYRIEHRLTRKCNYSCSYCYEVFDDTFDNIKVDFEGLRYYIESFKDTIIEYNIIGGEPTRHPQFKKLIEFLLEFDNLHILITSNGSKSLKFLNYISTDRLKILFSYHNSDTNIDDFMVKVSEISSHVKCVNVVDNPQLNNNAYEEYHELKRQLLEYDIELHLYPELGKLEEKPNERSQVINIQEPSVFEDVKKLWYYKNGLYQSWLDDSCKTKGRRCSITEHESVVQDNKIYPCVYFANKEKSGVDFKDCESIKPKFCRFEYCLFNAQFVD